MTSPAKLALEDGTVYSGLAFGAGGETFGEVVFNTSMTGYQEVLTDPSYKGQIVAMTYPHIGNYGITDEDRESRRPQVEGFIVRELTRNPSNYRSLQCLDELSNRKQHHRNRRDRYPCVGSQVARSRGDERRSFDDRS